MKKISKCIISIFLALSIMFMLTINSFAAGNPNTVISPVYQDFKNAENSGAYPTGSYESQYFSPGVPNYYKLTISLNGAYNIYSEGVKDMVGALYTKTGIYPFNWSPVLIVSNDDNGVGNDRNFRLETDMSTNISYWLAVRGYGSIEGEYQFTFEYNQDRTTMTTVPAHTKEGFNFPEMIVGSTWIQDSTYRENGQYDVIAYYSAEELKYLYAFLANAVLHDLMYADSIDEAELILEALGLATNFIPDKIVGTLMGFAISEIGMIYDEMTADERGDFLRELLETCGGQLGEDLVYHFSNNAKIVHYPTLFGEGFDIYVHNTNELVGNLGDRGQWASNDYYQ